MERIWRHASLKVPRKQPRRGRLWLNDGSCVRLRLVVVDEWTRECLSIDVAKQLGSDDVL